MFSIPEESTDYSINSFNTIMSINEEDVDDFNTIPMELKDLNMNWFDIVVRKDHFVNHKNSHQRKKTIKTKKNVIKHFQQLENEL